MDIQYVGDAGITQSCIEATCRHLQYGGPYLDARLLSAKGEHAFVLRTDRHELVAIRSGFASGYGGEAPRGLSTVLSLLQSFGIFTFEITVPPALLKRLNAAKLSIDDVRLITAPPPAFGGDAYHHMTLQHAFADRGELLVRTFLPVVPFGVLDPRLVDLAVSFWDEPDDRLMKGYRRLEDTIRGRTAVEEHGAKLFARVFGSGGPLQWSGLGSAESDARAQFFASAYRAFRNARAHREVRESPADQLAELMTLNHLYRLESQAVCPDGGGGQQA